MRKLTSITSILYTAAILAGCSSGSDELFQTNPPAPPVDGDQGSGSDDPTAGPEEQAADQGPLADLINGVDPLPVPPEKPISEVDSYTKQEQRETGSGNLGNFVCTYKMYSGTTQFQDLVSFDPQSDVLWPGSLVQGKSLPHGLLSPIGLPRAPGKITISNINVSGGAPDEDKYSRIVEQPSHASVQEAITDILSSAGEVNFSAKADFTMDRVYSLNHAAYKAGLSLEWMKGDIKAKFDQSSWTESTSVMVKFTQAYYTVSFETPSSPVSVFAPSVTAEDAAPYVGEENPPGYISSIVYGRMLLLKVESSASESELTGALSAKLKNVIGEVNVDLSAEQKKVLNESKMTLFALGGSAADVINIVANGAEGLEQYLVNGANFSPQSPGTPISYTVRSLRDNQAVKVAYSTDYEIPDCKLKANKIRIFLDYIQFNKNGDWLGKGDNDFKVWVNNGSGDITIAEGFVKSSDGEIFNQDKTKDILMPQEVGANFQVGFWANDTGSGANEYVTGTRVHSFDLQSTSWSDATTGLTLQDEDGYLKVTIGYNVEIIE
ncbi:MAG TPA: thiol-activated cytolysin family protein [Fimbriimonadaceae bacterium]|jgi:hypothetical protein|nr:thiol-activated cytolysin family protein [Fimbriimonadaceae bacterium]